MIKYYRVNNCRFNFSYTTKNYKCSTCNLYDHYIIEYKNINLINNLKKYYYDKVDENNECIYKKYHNTVFYCNNCNGRLYLINNNKQSKLYDNNES
jgi:hypothetical protein